MSCLFGQHLDEGKYESRVKSRLNVGHKHAKIDTLLKRACIEEPQDPQVALGKV